MIRSLLIIFSICLFCFESGSIELFGLEKPGESTLDAMGKYLVRRRAEELARFEANFEKLPAIIQPWFFLQSLRMEHILVLHLRDKKKTEFFSIFFKDLQEVRPGLFKDFSFEIAAAYGAWYDLVITGEITKRVFRGNDSSSWLQDLSELIWEKMIVMSENLLAKLLQRKKVYEELQWAFPSQDAANVRNILRSSGYSPQHEQLLRAYLQSYRFLRDAAKADRCLGALQ